MYLSSTLYWKINGTRCSEVVCPDHLGLQLLLLGPGLHNPLLLDVEAAVGQDLLGPLDHRDELLAIPDDDARVETFRDLGGSGAVGEISLTFTKDDLAEEEPCAVHETHPRQLGEVHTAPEEHQLSPLGWKLFQGKVIFNNFVKSLIGGAVKQQ